MKNIFNKRANNDYDSYCLDVTKHISLEFALNKVWRWKGTNWSILPTIQVSFLRENNKQPVWAISLHLVLVSFWICYWDE